MLRIFGRSGQPRLSCLEPDPSNGLLVPPFPNRVIAGKSLDSLFVTFFENASDLRLTARWLCGYDLSQAKLSRRSLSRVGIFHWLG